MSVASDELPAVSTATFADGYVWSVNNDNGYNICRSSFDAANNLIGAPEVMVASVPYVNDMAYNPADGLVYIITNEHLKSFDPANPGNMQDHGAIEHDGFKLAINMEGDAYMISSWGEFGSLNLSNAQLTVINSIDLPIKMAFDMLTGELFGAHYGNLYQLDPNTGTYTMLGALHDGSTGYEADFPKYKKKVDPQLLIATMKSAATQVTKKFVYSRVPGEYKTAEVKKALNLLIKAGILIPVTHTSGNGLPLGDEADESTRKILLLDTGLMLRLLNMTMGDTSVITTQILTASAADLVNKGPLAEMLAGLELLHYLTPNLRHELYYWVRQARNSTAEIDYLLSRDLKVLPFEVKAGVQGGMKSLWDFMREKKLYRAVRCSLENFGKFDYIDVKAEGAVRHVDIYPLYAMSQFTLRELPDYEGKEEC